jgi:hypothetical protein
MKEKTKQDLYTAIHENIMELRIKIKMKKIEDIDAALFELTEDIWRVQSQILNIK